MSITYQVGQLTMIDEADPELPNEQAAIELAIAESERDDKSPFGVWTGQSHGSELVAIAYQGQLFRSAF
ncbi:hypothetical protein [Chromobacterium haemolyticum]|uniref:hypothetical protein n=1 Tax=Chromobacterium haemolyticum TaxID=394935 RepID=UPI002449655A|nr:hypothetical protein [Chromobacterium haemolyticum]MDH0342025.1 hypothetical protein [Chromobacterium haemolyticum]